MATGKLTAGKVENAKPRARPYRLADGGGMFLEVRPNGSKYWRMAYRFGGKQKQLALGVYPDVPLAGRKDRTIGDPENGYWLDGAREKRDKARKQLAAGIDPGEMRKVGKLRRAGADSFSVVAAEWQAKIGLTWTPAHAQRVQDLLDNDLLPFLGKRPVNEITAPEFLAVLRRVEARGALGQVARCKRICSGTMGYAVATGLAERNPVKDLTGAFQARPVKHHASITDPKRIGQLMRDIRGYQGFFVTKCALELAPLLFVRPGELRKAEWPEFDLDAAEWRIPGHRMKLRERHIVPLAKQAVEILRRLHQVTGHRRLLFPGVRHHDKPLSENTLNGALRYMGYTKDEMTSHGFRSIASTLLNEQGWHRDAIERQLAHAERDKVRASYNYAEHLPERRRMMQAWADHLDSLASGAEIAAIGHRSKKDRGKGRLTEPSRRARNAAEASFEI